MALQPHFAGAAEVLAAAAAISQNTRVAAESPNPMAPWRKDSIGSAVRTDSGIGSRAGAAVPGSAGAAGAAVQMREEDTLLIGSAHGATDHSFAGGASATVCRTSGAGNYSSSYADAVAAAAAHAAGAGLLAMGVLGKMGGMLSGIDFAGGSVAGDSSGGQYGYAGSSGRLRPDGGAGAGAAVYSEVAPSTGVGNGGWGGAGGGAGAGAGAGGPRGDEKPAVDIDSGLDSNTLDVADDDSSVYSSSAPARSGGAQRTVVGGFLHAHRPKYFSDGYSKELSRTRSRSRSAATAPQMCGDCMPVWMDTLDAAVLPAPKPPPIWDLTTQDFVNVLVQSYDGSGAIPVANTVAENLHGGMDEVRAVLRGLKEEQMALTGNDLAQVAGLGATQQQPRVTVSQRQMGRHTT